MTLELTLVASGTGDWKPQRLGFGLTTGDWYDAGAALSIEAKGLPVLLIASREKKESSRKGLSLVDD